MGQDGVVTIRLPHMFLKVIQQGAEDRDSGERVSGSSHSPVPAAQPNPS